MASRGLLGEASAMTGYGRRLARPEDLYVLERIYRQNMKAYVENVAQWRPDFFRRQFRPQDFEVFLVEEEVIGMLKVVRNREEIYVAEIQIRHDYQDRGIGSRLLGELFGEARRSLKPLWLQVIKGNPAEKLYRRLGMWPFQETPTHRKLIYRPELRRRRARS